jgi:hypothetical protein
MAKVVTQLALDQVRFYTGLPSRIELDQYTVPVDIDVDIIFPIPIDHLCNVSKLIMDNGDGKLAVSIARVIGSMPIVSIPVKTSGLLLLITGSPIESIICSFELLRYYMVTLVVLNNFKTAAPKYDLRKVFEKTLNRLWNFNKDIAIKFLLETCKIKEGVDLHGFSSVKDAINSIESVGNEAYNAIIQRESINQPKALHTVDMIEEREKLIEKSVKKLSSHLNKDIYKDMHEFTVDLLRIYETQIMDACSIPEKHAELFKTSFSYPDVYGDDDITIEIVKYCRDTNNCFTSWRTNKPFSRQPKKYEFFCQEDIEAAINKYNDQKNADDGKGDSDKSIQTVD